MNPNRNKKIGLIGRVDPGRTLFDGQTVKTRMMYRLLCDMYSAECIEVVDTINWRHRSIQILTALRKCFNDCDDIIILLSRNGRKVLYPVLAYAAKSRGKRIYQNLIGGWLDDDLKQHPKWVKFLNAFRVNWVESNRLVDALSNQGVANAKYLPNFKYLDASNIPEIRAYGTDWHFCMFSRVMKEKGTRDAMAAIEALNNDEDGCTYGLDIYGPVDSSFDEEFKRLLDKCPHSKYLGSVAPEESVHVVSRYDALLFPTCWIKEGIPGTIIDALTAGVPVIGAKWLYYDELLEDGVTALGYDFGHNNLLAGTIRRFVELTDKERNSMRYACLESAKTYTPEAVAKEIKRAIGQ